MAFFAKEGESTSRDDATDGQETEFQPTLALSLIRIQLALRRLTSRPGLTSHGWWRRSGDSVKQTVTNDVPQSGVERDERRLGLRRESDGRRFVKFSILISWSQECVKYCNITVTSYLLERREPLGALRYTGLSKLTALD